MKILETKKVNMTPDASYGVSLEETASSLIKGFDGGWIEGDQMTRRSDR